MVGSEYFRYFRGTKKECQNWLHNEIEAHGGWIYVQPIKIFTEKEARKVRFQDGSLVFKCFSKNLILEEK